MSQRAWRALFSAALATGALVGCARDQGGELRVAVRDSVASLDPHIVDDRPTFYLLRNVYEPLAEHDPAGAVVPSLATAWSNPDERTWRFELRRGVTFHDGRTLTSRDVRHTLERARSHPQSWLREDLAGVVSVSTAGDHALEVRTRGPSPLLLQSLARVLIVPDGWAETAANGTGPYRVESWRKELTLLRGFAGYWRGPPRWTAVEVRTLPTGGARVDALSRGEVDLIDFPPLSLVASPRPGAPAHLIETPAAAVAILGLRVGGSASNPFADPKVREAVALAINQQALVRLVLAGRGEPATQLAPSGIFGYVPDLPLPRHDPPAARATLQASRFRQPVRAELLCSPSGQSLAEAVAAQVRASGVELTPRVLPWEEFDRRLNARQADAFIFSLTYPELDSTNLVVSSFHTVRPEARRGTMNFSGYSEPELDPLLERAEAEFDPQARYTLIAQATRRVLASRVWLPLYVQHDTYAARAGLRWKGGLAPGIAFERVVREQ